MSVSTPIQSSALINPTPDIQTLHHDLVPNQSKYLPWASVLLLNPNSLGGSGVVLGEKNQKAPGGINMTFLAPSNAQGCH